MLRIPVGTTAQRPNSNFIDCSGCIRYNSDTTQFEGWSPTGESWIGLGGVIDIDQDTYIAAEENSDEDKLRFYTARTQKMIVDTNGNVGIGTDSPSTKLEVSTNLNAVTNSITTLLNLKQRISQHNNGPAITFSVSPNGTNYATAAKIAGI